LEQQKKCVPTDLQTYCDMAVAFFDKKLSRTTASRYLAESQLSWKCVGGRYRPEGMDHETYVLHYYQWVIDQHESGFFVVDRSKLCSFDFVTDSYRLFRIKTFAKRGSKQPKFSRAKPTYTNSFLACIWGDGQNRTPALLFTHNPDLNPAGPNHQQVLYWCEVYGIDAKRIYFTEGGKKYCKEDGPQASTFLQLYDCWRGVHVLSDAGHAWKRNGEFVFEFYHAARHQVYTPAVHGELSPNDNLFHAVAKNDWVSKREQVYDGVEHPLCLLRMLDTVPSETIASFFTYNFVLDQTPTVSIVEQRLIGREGPKENRENYFDRCDALYRDFVDQSEGLELDDQLEHLDNGLDGNYWRKTK
jgi:hypothetical protein